MARAKEVSEKTLELNVCAEVLNFIRGWPGCADAFWIGMKQFEEARTGTDEALANIPDGLHLALQFKSPWASRPDTEPYKYSINWLQQDKLMDLAGAGGAVYYVFPNYNTMRRLVAAPLFSQHIPTSPLSWNQGGCLVDAIGRSASRVLPALTFIRSEWNRGRRLSRKHLPTHQTSFR